MAKKKTEGKEDAEVGDLVSLTEAAELRGVTVQAIQDLIKRKRLVPVVVARRRVLRRGDVLAFQPEVGGRGRKAGG